MKQQSMLILLSFMGITTIHTQSTVPPAMVYVLGGTFMMGCTPEQPALQCNTDENPAHEISLSDFEIGKYEVSQGEWKSLMDGSNPSRFPKCGLDCPVEQVSWYDVLVYCNRLSENFGYTSCYYADPSFTKVYGKTGSQWRLPQPGSEGVVFWNKVANGYRLPTEAEWEYASRGGIFAANTLYSGANNLDSVGWHWNNSQVTYSPNHYGKGTHPKGVKKPNHIGLYDMSGNVWEWTFDYYSSNYYVISPGCAPVNDVAGQERVHRGGAWTKDKAPDFRVARRGHCDPGGMFMEVGFRLARRP